MHSIGKNHASVSSSEIICDRLTVFLACTVCVLYGVCIATLPHLIFWLKTGHAIWIADHDDLDLYLALTGHSYRFHPMSLSDPVHGSGGVYVPSLTSIPAVLLAKAFAMGPLLVGMASRVLAGIGLGICWFTVFRSFTMRAWVAAGLAIMLLADEGLLFVHPVFGNFHMVGQILAGRDALLFAGNPQVHTEWRVPDPALPLVLLLAYVYFLSRALLQPSGRAILLAGVSLGLNFVFFYNWTALLGGACFAVVLDYDRWRTYLKVTGLGVLLGSVSLVENIKLKQSAYSGWPQRFDLVLPINHFSELSFPKWPILVLMVTALLIWRLRRSDLWFIWSVGASALVLLNNQIVTGLQFENFHWVYVWGPMLSLLVVLFFAEFANRFDLASHPVAVNGLLVVLILDAGAGLWLREQEATRTQQSVQLTEAANDYVSQRLSFSYDSLAPNAVVAGDSTPVSLSAIRDGLRPLAGYLCELSAYIDDNEWDRRTALNQFLLGQSVGEFAATQKATLEAATQRGPWARSSIARNARFEDRMRAFAEISADPDAAFVSAKVRYVILMAERRAPHYVSSGWREIEAGPYCQIWERTAPFP
jgi:hypothetical protein